MSVNLGVYLRDDRLPTFVEWQQQIANAGLQLEMESFDPRDHSGFIPCRLNGVPCGFELYVDTTEEPDPEDVPAIGDRDWRVTLRLSGGSMTDLVDISDGVFDDGSGGIHPAGTSVFDLMAADEVAERERGRFLAAKDAAITDRRCPFCKAPCLAYRKSCKACGKPQPPA